MKRCLTTRSRVAPTLNSPENLSQVTHSASSLSQSQLNKTVMEILNHKQGRYLFGTCSNNPISHTGKRTQVLHLLGMVMLPIVALLGLVCYILSSQIQAYLQTSEVRASVRYSLELSDLLFHIQRERDISAFYVSAIGPETKVQLLQSYIATDNALASLTDWVPSQKAESKTRDSFQNFLNRHRYNLDIIVPSPEGELTFYSDLMEDYVTWFYSAISEARSGSVWKDLVAMQELQSARDSFGIERAMGAIYYARGGFADMKEYRKFAENFDAGNAAVKAARQFSVPLSDLYNKTLYRLEKEQARLNHMRITVKTAILTRTNVSLVKADEYFNGMTVYMDTYREMQYDLANIIEKKMLKGVEEENKAIVILGTVFGMVLLMCPLIVKAVYALTTDMQKFSMRLVDRTKALDTEKKKTDALLYQMLPKAVADRLKKNESVTAESFAEVSIFFSDIVGFTSISARSSPIQVVEMLNSLYTCFDNTIETFDVYKVETIGDAYMVASGLPQRNGNRHASEIACLSLDLMDLLMHLPIPHMPGKSMRMRIGINTGSVVAGVVGIKMPRYCLFGKAVSHASILESSGEAGKIHISEKTHTILMEVGGFVMKKRETEFDELNFMKTYWLLHRVGGQRTDIRSRTSSGSLSPLYADQINYPKSGKVLEWEEDHDSNPFIERRAEAE